MGTGKSTVGRQVARQMDFHFLDSDHEIERKQGHPVSKIFAEQGEPAFRAMEREFIEHGHPDKRCVISCGGGLVGAARHVGTPAPPRRGHLHACADRDDPAAHDARHAPAAGSRWRIPSSVLRDLYAQREALYRRTGTMVLTDKRPLREIAAHGFASTGRKRHNSANDHAGRVAGDRRATRIVAGAVLLTLGFDAVRFAPARPLAGDGLQAWLQAGQHADMAWMERTAATARRSRTRAARSAHGDRARGQLLAGCLSRESGIEDRESDIGRGMCCTRTITTRSSRAWPRPGRVLEEEFGLAEADHRYYVDTGPLLERGLAARSGLGFRGKNCDAEFERIRQLAVPRHACSPGSRSNPTRPCDPKRLCRWGKSRRVCFCGKCTRCLDACPTDAFPAPGVVDARRCVSYQTIENKGVIPRELRTGIGARIYGCDVCLDVCPWKPFRAGGRAGGCCWRRAMTSRT